MAGALEGRKAVITGASRGLGLEIARAFLREGADLALCARDPQRLSEARKELAASAGDRTIFAEPADVSNVDDVTRVVGTALDHLGKIDVLVNCAGVLGPAGPVDGADWSDWTRAVSINLFGSVLMARAVLPHMRERRSGKIIQLSGGGATSPMPGVSAYAASKAAVVRFAETLAEEVRPFGIDVNSVAPGALNTRMLDEMIEAGPEALGNKTYERVLEQKRSGGASFARATALCVFFASPASDGITGKLVSAVWDPWETLAGHRQDLEGDVYTLRRIVPKDRGFPWGDR